MSATIDYINSLLELCANNEELTVYVLAAMCELKMSYSLTENKNKQVVDAINRGIAKTAPKGITKRPPLIHPCKCLIFKD
jgi:hypothetical protein